MESFPVVRASRLHPDDVADVVVAVMTDDCHARRTDEAIGPRSLSFAEAVEELALATGRTVRYFQISTGANAALLARHEVGEEVVMRLQRIVTGLLDGCDARLTAASTAALNESRAAASTGLAKRV